MLAIGSEVIGLIIAIAVALLSSLFKKKEEEFELPPELKPRRDKPSPPPARNWEQELRGLLEQQPAPPPLVKPVPPPIPSRVTRPVVVAEPEVEPHIEVTLRTPHPRVEPAFHQLRGLTESGIHYADAASLQERVTQHLADVTKHRVGTTSVERREASAEVSELMKSLRNPRSVRTAMMASIVLGPPLALAEA
jgi:hypothetical protein